MGSVVFFLLSKKITKMLYFKTYKISNLNELINKGSPIPLINSKLNKKDFIQYPKKLNITLTFINLSLGK